jgi:hypothetical protein
MNDEATSEKFPIPVNPAWIASIEITVSVALETDMFIAFHIVCHGMFS